MHDVKESVWDVLERTCKAMAAGALNADIATSAGRSGATYSSHDRWAGILLVAEGATEESWARREELSTDLYQELATMRGPSPAETLSASFREIDTSQPVEPITCTSCRIRPGFGPCPRCSGVGVLLVRTMSNDTTAVEDCPECEDGFAPCTACGGSTRAIAATVRYVDRKPMHATQLVLPEPVSHLRDVLLGGFPDPSSVPPDLLLDLEGKVTSSAYRGSRPGGWTDYRGYRLDDAVRRAEMFVRRVRNAPRFVLRELRSYALPFVVARFETADDVLRIVLYVDSGGIPRFQRL